MNFVTKKLKKRETPGRCSLKSNHIKFSSYEMKTTVLKIQPITFIYIKYVVKFNLDTHHS